MKSYTDIEQSRKLAEFLPLESADMVYAHTVDLEGDEHYDIDFRNKNPLFEDDVCAWSLAALLGVLSDYTLQTNTDRTVFVVCDSKKPMISDAYDNPVDACVDMIEKLHELNLL